VRGRSSPLLLDEFTIVPLLILVYAPSSHLSFYGTARSPLDDQRPRCFFMWFSRLHALFPLFYHSLDRSTFRFPPPHVSPPCVVLLPSRKTESGYYFHNQAKATSFPIYCSPLPGPIGLSASSFLLGASVPFCLPSKLEQSFLCPFDGVSCLSDSNRKKPLFTL